jgi:hypothetical protein
MNTQNTIAYFGIHTDLFSTKEAAQPSQSPSSPMLHFQQTEQSGCKAKDGQARQECEQKLSWDAMATG